MMLKLKIIKTKNTPEKYATRNNSPKKFPLRAGKGAPLPFQLTRAPKIEATPLINLQH